MSNKTKVNIIWVHIYKQKYQGHNNGFKSDKSIETVMNFIYVGYFVFER